MGILKALGVPVNVNTFSIVTGFLYASQVLGTAYSKSIISQIEKRFGVTSSFVGTLRVAKNAGSIISYLWLLRYSQTIKHRPRAIAYTASLSICGSLVAAAIHWLSPPYDFTATMNRVETDPTFQSLCNATMHSPDCGTTGESASYADIHNLVYIFYIAEFLYGVGSSPIMPLGLTYMHDNSDNIKSIQNYSVLLGLIPIGWAFSFGAGGLFLKLWVHWPASPPLDNGVPLTPDHDAWVGAWWIGYVVWAVAVAMCTLPMLSFPEKLKTDSVDKTENIPLANKKLELEAPKEKDFEKLEAEFNNLTTFRRLKCIATNKVLLFVILSGIIRVFDMQKSFFMAKYIEMHFGLTASEANFLFALQGPIVISVTLSSGYIYANYLKFNARQMIKWIVALKSLGVIGVLSWYYITCPNDSLRGLFVDEAYTDYDSCGCRTGRKDIVCAEEFAVDTSTRYQYQTACHAACHSQTHGQDNSIIYTDCVDGVNVSASYCKSEVGCSYGGTTTFMWLVLLISMMNCSIQAPIAKTMMDVIPLGQHTLGISVFRLSNKMLGGLWAGPLMGKVIEAACMVFSRDDCGNTGSCLVYDKDILRFNYVIYSEVTVILSILSILPALMLKPAANTELAKYT